MWTRGRRWRRSVQPDQLKGQPEDCRDPGAGHSDSDSRPRSIPHNGVIDGKVMRIDPGVLNGTVTVDVELAGALPLGARPDLSVDGTIDLDRMADVLFVGRPGRSEMKTARSACSSWAQMGRRRFVFR